MAGAFAVAAGAVTPFAQVVLPMRKVDGSPARTRFLFVFVLVAPPENVDCMGAAPVAPVTVLPPEMLVSVGGAAATVAFAVADAFAPSPVVTNTCKACGPAACEAGKTIE